MLLSSYDIPSGAIEKAGFRRAGVPPSSPLASVSAGVYTVRPMDIIGHISRGDRGRSRFGQGRHRASGGGGHGPVHRPIPERADGQSRRTEDPGRRPPRRVFTRARRATGDGPRDHSFPGKADPRTRSEDRRTTASKTELEDLYLPYKPKRVTRASKARDAGLEPLARWLEELEAPRADLDRQGRGVHRSGKGHRDVRTRPFAARATSWPKRRPTTPT